MRRRRKGDRRGLIKIVVLIAAVLLPAPKAHAIDLFEIFVVNTDGSGVPDLTVGGWELPELLEDLVNAQGAFASFAGVAFSADISFAGVANAINITVDPATQTATLTFTALGVGAQTFTFTGADLWQQLEDFLQDNLSDQLAEFIHAINLLSLVAVTDGTPLSTTALSADYVFDRFALHDDLTRAERRAAATQELDIGLRGRFDAYYSNIDTDVADGYSLALAPSMEYIFNRDLSIGFLFPITYTNIEDAEVLNAHIDVAMPWRLLHPSENNPLGLRVTPFGTLALSGSVDMVQGAIIGGGGLQGTATLELGELTLSASVQYSFHESIALRYESWEFDPHISQQILKAGGKVTQRLGDNLYIYGTFVYSTFLQDAAIDDWITPGAGLGYRLANGLNISAGYTGDIADGYNTHNLRATFQLPF
ncbi:MAG: hypothetical protein ACYTGF_09310 [Planctomycetota bacterium]|jgi:hypothetical protein